MRVLRLSSDDEAKHMVALWPQARARAPAALAPP